MTGNFYHHSGSAQRASLLILKRSSHENIQGRYVLIITIVPFQYAFYGVHLLQSTLFSKYIKCESLNLMEVQCKSFAYLLAAFASSTEAELRVSYARILWSVSVFCVPLRLCAKWVSWPSDSDFGD